MQKLRKLENKMDKKIFSLFNIDKSITIGNIIDSFVENIGHKN